MTTENQQLPSVTMTLTPIQQGWVQLANLRIQTFEALQAGELRIQQYNSEIRALSDLVKVQELLKAMKDLFAEKKEQRLRFTNLIKERIVDKAMEFEKRSEPIIAESEKHELTLRQIEVAKTNAANSKNAELAQFKAHVENGYFTKAANYRSAITKLISDAYTTALNDKVPLDTIPQYIERVKGFMREIPLQEFHKFVPILISPEDMTAEFEKIRPYDPTEDFNKGLAAIDEQFQMYAEDSKNAAAAIVASQNQTAQELNKIATEVQTEVATNNLVASSSNFSFSGGPVIRKKVEIVVESTDEWAMTVLSAFIVNWKEARDRVRVKTIDKLSIGQMGAALAALVSEKGATFNKLTFKEIEK